MSYKGTGCGGAGISVTSEFENRGTSHAALTTSAPMANGFSNRLCDSWHWIKGTGV